MFVRNWMSTPVVTIPKVVPAEAAREFMVKRKVRRLPVVDGDRLVGIVTLSDLQAGRRPGAFVDDLMTADPLTVAPDETLEQAAKIMLERKISGIPVVENDRLTGIITESDVFRALCELMGVKEKGARVVFTVPGGGDLLDALRKRLTGLVPRSLAMIHNPENDRWEVVMRVRGRAPSALRKG